MRVKRAVITSAAPRQRSMPLQALIDRDGEQKPLLRILLAEVRSAAIDEVGLVIHPDDEQVYRQAAGDLAGMIRFLPQPEPRGYGHAIFCAQPFVRQDPFLHLVGDHLYVSANAAGCAQHLVDVAEAEACAVSSVQATREHLLSRFGAVAGPRVSGKSGLYRIETVIEKPSPTQAEQDLLVPGLRAGYYLCFFGMHVLTPTVMEILDQQLQQQESGVTLSGALAVLMKREQYLALEASARRYDLGQKYGFLTAQVALALNGRDRDEVLVRMLELLMGQQIEGAAGRGGHE